MTRLMGTAAFALALALGAPAVAQDEQLRAQAGTVLAEHGYGEVDTSLLTTEQLARLQTLEAAQGDGGDVQMTQAIDEILVMDAGTAIFVSEEMQAMFADPEYPELRANARTLLGEAGYDPELAAAMTIEQLAQLWFLQEAPERNQPATLTTRIQAILEPS